MHRAWRLPTGAVLAVLLCASAATGLHLEVNAHYPEHGSAMEYCGFQLQVATPLSNPRKPATMTRVGPDHFRATLELSDDFLYTMTTIGVLAQFSHAKFHSPECNATCFHLAPQGQVGQLGPYPQTEALGPFNKVDLWPSFCGLDGDWRTITTKFHSKSVGRTVHIKARMPAAAVENKLPRPAKLLAPIMFRFNPEWYFPDADNTYTAWHGLMVSGAMQPVVMAEVHFERVEWTSWSTQVILTKDLPHRACPSCDPELGFVCDDWERKGFYSYNGSDHDFGMAVAFFDELYDLGVPQLMEQLPRSSDGGLPQLGLWGYCIGGLAAWSGLTSRPDRFSIAYLGSPAMDFNCGSPFKAVENFSWPAGRPPKVYLDSGASEDALMGRQVMLLLRRLQAKGLVEGRDVFYEEAPFGTHQTRTILKRALRGLLVLFGTGSAGNAPYAPVVQEVSAATASGMNLSFWWSAASYPACALAAFAIGRFGAYRSHRGRCHGQMPLLS